MEALAVTLQAAAAAAAGSAVASVLACVPGLHIYNVMGLMVAGLHAWGAGGGEGATPEVLLAFSCGLIVGYAVVSAIPSVVLAAPDESALFTVLPGQKYLLAGRGYAGVMLTAAGGLAALLMLVPAAGAAAPVLVPGLRAVLRPHAHWVVWCVVSFMILSEWPRGGRLGPGGWRKFLDAWSSTGAGLLTFLLSGLLGFVLFYRPPFAAEFSFQGLMPAFAGLFTVPWLILNLASGVEAPPQDFRLAGAVDARRWAAGAAVGCLGGGFAAFFPAVTGGVGGLLAGHAAAVRDDRVFLVSQGAAKVAYYAGAFVLFALPGAGMAKGGGAALIRLLYVPGSPSDYTVVLGAAALAGGVAWALVGPLARATIRVTARYGLRRISAVSLGLVALLVLACSGLAGLSVAATAAGIGLIPPLCGARRMNALGVILLPLACSLSGFGERVAGWLGLL